MTSPARWIPPVRLRGAWQMAIDEWLLDQALRPGQANQGLVVRLYQWERPTLSIGFHQRRLPDHWFQLVDSGTVEMVRRPSGGRAVLHEGDLTYCLVWPHPPAHRQQTYRLACGWLQQTFRTIGLPLVFGHQSAGQQISSCFATHTAADLIHASCGAKRIGSAQLWRQGCLLQHGSILISPSHRLWRSVFGDDPPRMPALNISIDNLTEQLFLAAQRHLPLDGGRSSSLGVSPLTTAELTAIGERMNRYKVPLGDQGVDLMSPARSIDSTT